MLHLLLAKLKHTYTYARKLIHMHAYSHTHKGTKHKHTHAHTRTLTQTHPHAPTQTHTPQTQTACRKTKRWSNRVPGLSEQTGPSFWLHSYWTAAAPLENAPGSLLFVAERSMCVYVCVGGGKGRVGNVCARMHTCVLQLYALPESDEARPAHWHDCWTWSLVNTNLWEALIIFSCGAARWSSRAVAARISQILKFSIIRLERTGWQLSSIVAAKRMPGTNRLGTFLNCCCQKH